MEDVGLKSHEKANFIDVATSEYLDRTQTRIFELRRCAQRLNEKISLCGKYFIQTLSEANRTKHNIDQMCIYANVSIATGREQKQIKSPPVQKFSNVPRKHPYFVGRRELLHALQQQLCPSSGTTHSEPLSCLIYGIGGIGKTQLARAYSDSSTYDYHFLVQAESVAKLAESFHTIANALGLPTLPSNPNMVEMVKAALEEHKSSWLLIFDNVEDTTFDEVVEAMPNKTTNASAIIVTSQFDDLKHYTQSAIPLTSLTEQEGVDLLSKCLRKDLKAVLHPEHELLRDISARLGGLPLALAHTGGYMSKSNDDLSEFKDFFNDRWERIVYPTRQRIVHQYEYQTLAVVWDFALAKLDPDSRKLINILAFLNADDIDKRWLIEERRLTHDWVEDGLSPETQYNPQCLPSAHLKRCLLTYW